MARVKTARTLSVQENHGPHPRNEPVLRRLRKIEGQIRGIQRMVEGETYCVDILTQLAAVRAALAAVGSIILKRHLDSSVSAAILNGGVQRDKIIGELMRIVSKEQT